MSGKIDVSSKIAQLSLQTVARPSDLAWAGPRLRHPSLCVSSAASAVTGESWVTGVLPANTRGAMRARSAVTRQAGHPAAQCGHNSQTVIIIISVITIIIISDFC